MLAVFRVGPVYARLSLSGNHIAFNKHGPLPSGVQSPVHSPGWIEIRLVVNNVEDDIAVHRAANRGDAVTPGPK